MRYARTAWLKPLVFFSFGFVLFFSSVSEADCPWDIWAALSGWARTFVSSPQPASKEAEKKEEASNGLLPVAPGWWKHEGSDALARLDLPRGLALKDATIPRLFFEQAKAEPDEVILHDNVRGSKTNRDVVAGVYTMLPLIKSIKSKYVGIMLPPSGSYTIATLTTQVAGKVPVMFNPMLGGGPLGAQIDLTKPDKIITSRKYVEGLEEKVGGMLKFKDKFIFLEDLAETNAMKARYVIGQMRAKLPPSTWHEIRNAKPDEVAMIFFTSGSTSGQPSGVQVTHVNLISSAKGILEAVDARKKHRLLGFLPGFHIFGGIGTYTLPLTAGVQVGFAPNPLNRDDVLAVSKQLGLTAVIGTDGLLSPLAAKAKSLSRAAKGDPEKSGHLGRLDLVVAGAEPFRESTRTTLGEASGPTLHNPDGSVRGVGGYGMTEVMAVFADDPANPTPGSVGYPLPGVDVAIVDPDDHSKALPAGSEGLLVVRGPNVMKGYLGGKETPQVEHRGLTWFNTGDIAVKDPATGKYFIKGRAGSDFVKMPGGERVGLNDISKAIQAGLSPGDDQTKFIVVANTKGEKPKLVLLTTVPLGPEDTKKVNATISAAGLNALHNIDQIVVLRAFPLLPSFKTDMRTIRQIANGDIEIPEELKARERRPSASTENRP